MALAASSARFQQRAGAFGLSAGVAMDLRLGWDLGLEADQVKASESHVLGFLPAAGAQHETRPTGRTAGAGEASLGVCVQSGRIASQARWTRSLRVPFGCVVGDRWHAQGPLRSNVSSE